MAPCRLLLEGLVCGPVHRSTVGVVACRFVPPVRAQNVLTTCELQYGAKTRRNAFRSSLSQIGTCGAKCRHSVDRFAQGVHGGEEDSDDPESAGTFWKASQNARFWFSDRRAERRLTPFGKVTLRKIRNDKQQQNVSHNCVTICAINFYILRARYMQLGHRYPALITHTLSLQAPSPLCALHHFSEAWQACKFLRCIIKCFCAWNYSNTLATSSTLRQQAKASLSCTTACYAGLTVLQQVHKPHNCKERIQKEFRIYFSYTKVHPKIFFPLWQ